MKTRNGFVSNSSSSSFTIQITNDTSEDVLWKDFAKKYARDFTNEMHGCGLTEEDCEYFDNEFIENFGGSKEILKAGRRYLYNAVSRGGYYESSDLTDLDSPGCGEIKLTSTPSTAL